MTLLSVKVKCGAKRNQVKALGNNSYEVLTTAEARDGEANAAVMRLLAKQLDIGVSLVKIKRGYSSRNKLLEVIDR